MSTLRAAAASLARDNTPWAVTEPMHQHDPRPRRHHFWPSASTASAADHASYRSVVGRFLSRVSTGEEKEKTSSTNPQAESLSPRRSSAGARGGGDWRPHPSAGAEGCASGKSRGPGRAPRAPTAPCPSPAARPALGMQESFFDCGWESSSSMPSPEFCIASSHRVRKRDPQSRSVRRSFFLFGSFVSRFQRKCVVKPQHLKNRHHVHNPGGGGGEKFNRRS